MTKRATDRKATKAGKERRGRWLLAVLLVVGVGGLTMTFWPQVRFSEAVEPATQDLRPTLAALSTELAAARAQGDIRSNPTSAPAASPPSLPTQPERRGHGVVAFVRQEGSARHLWAIEPGSVEGSPLTQGDWRDEDPAIGPAGRRLAFRSNRDGPWDLYLMDLTSGSVQRLTQTPGYEGHPSWSPDGRWLAYEAYRDGDLDIWILALDGQQPPIQLTNHPGLDTSPSWDPAAGRRIAFISDREGSKDVFLADLDRPNERFRNVTNSPDWAESEPDFNPSGQRLAYATASQGVELVWTLSIAAPDALPQQIGIGGDPSWSPDGRSILAIQETPHERIALTYLLDGSGPGVSVALTQRGGGLQPDWGQTDNLPSPRTALAELEAGAQGTRTVVPAEGAGRLSLITLDGVEAPNPQLAEPADVPFRRLRGAVERAAGWDFLGSLDAAFVGLNDPLPPGFAYNDWLYTGRAFAFPLSAYRAGWVVVVREPYGERTYWRVFLKTTAQDGSQGQPLDDYPWDFEARYRGDPSDYDRGGEPQASIPAGYYVDFTALAAAHGFERQPALTNWRNFFPGARFNEYAYTEGLDWLAAMRQLYPEEAIATPTPFASPSPTPTNTPWPTATPWWWRWRTPTPTQPPPTPLPSSPLGP